MNTKTKKALDDSIVKWRKNLSFAEDGEYHSIRVDAESCALCNLFLMNEMGRYIQDYSKKCRGCPVYEKTGIIGCEDTPYDDVLDILNEIDDEIESFGEVRKEYVSNLELAIDLEIKFLESLTSALSNEEDSR